MDEMKIPRVLIAEDKKDIRTFIKIILQKDKEYEFIEASNGKEAVDAAKKYLPHIILMDGMMPQMNGFEAIEILREDPLTKNIPILMISSLDNKDEKVKALKSGISDFISKPFDQTELIIRVNSLLHLYLKFLDEREKLEQINSDLEAKVKQKLEKRLTDIRLASIGQLATSITHELNTPISYMKSNIEMLKLDIEETNFDDNLKESIYDTLDTLDGGIKRLRGIIDTTREMSKKSDHKKKKQNLYETIVLSARMVSTRTKHLSSVFINDMKFDYDLSIDNEIYEIEMFKEKLEQVWIIVLNNACDEFETSVVPFEERKIDIRIYFDSDNKLNIEFRDNAKGGIDEKILPKIFEPFVSSKENSGIGVGLNIAHEIIEMHNGTIEAYNDNGFAVFSIKL